MPASAVTIFSANKDDLRISDLTGATIKMGLVSSVYTPSTGEAGHSVWADISANEITAANGYTAGGATLATPTKTAITNGWKFSTGNASWTASGGNIAAWRYGVIYVSGALWGMTNPVIGIFTGDNTPADVPATSSGNSLTVTCPAAGWFDIT